MASWTTDDGCIDISAPSRPGIVKSYILHSVKINGEFYQHVFAIVWWCKADCDESYHLANQLKYGNSMIMNLVALHCLCLCRELGTE